MMKGCFDLRKDKALLIQAQCGPVNAHAHSFHATAAGTSSSCMLQLLVLELMTLNSTEGRKTES